MKSTIRVSVRPHFLAGNGGYIVKWHDGKKQRSYYVLSKAAALETKARAKAGKLPRCWAVKA